MCRHAYPTIVSKLPNVQFHHFDCFPPPSALIVEQEEAVVVCFHDKWVGEGRTGFENDILFDAEAVQLVITDPDRQRVALILNAWFSARIVGEKDPAIAKTV